MAFARPQETTIETGHSGVGFYEAAGKRITDIVLAVALLPLVAPVVIALWLLARQDGGPGFYGQVRIGQDQKKFRCWKIRTMSTNAAEMLERHLADNPEAAEEWAQDHKLTHDPRVTRLGRFLRATSLDELPQLWNVLRGEMSFVGPRPIVSDEVSKYGVYFAHYVSVKPGITGLWQVSGRNDISYDERVELDVAYTQSHSFLGDLGLIAKTGQAVLGKTGK